MSIEWIQKAVVILKALHIEHSLYVRARSEAQSAAFCSADRELILIVGPTRAGKTRLLKEVFGAHLKLEPDADGRMRTVYVEAGNDSNAGSFSTKNFYFEALGAVHHPVYGSGSRKRRGDSIRVASGSEWEMHKAFGRCLHHRRTEYLVIDEAHHVSYAPGGKAAAARILDGFKSLANRSSCRLVLCGAYSLLELLPLSPHLCGRTNLVEVPRYGTSRPDMISFSQVLQNLNAHLRFRKGESLLTWGDILLKQSLGCIGILIRWLRDALAKALTAKSPVLTLEHLLAAQAPGVMRAAIADEIEKGETLLRSVQAGTAPSPAARTGTEGENGNAGAAGVRAQAPGRRAGKTRNRRKPFCRRTRRNPLGGRA